MSGTVSHVLRFDVPKAAFERLTSHTRSIEQQLRDHSERFHITCTDRSDCRHGFAFDEWRPNIRVSSDALYLDEHTATLVPVGDYDNPAIGAHEATYEIDASAPSAISTYLGTSGRVTVVTPLDWTLFHSYYQLEEPQAEKYDGPMQVNYVDAVYMTFREVTSGGVHTTGHISRGSVDFPLMVASVATRASLLETDAKLQMTHGPTFSTPSASLSLDTFDVRFFREGDDEVGSLQCFLSRGGVNYVRVVLLGMYAHLTDADHERVHGLRYRYGQAYATTALLRTLGVPRSEMALGNVRVSFQFDEARRDLNAAQLVQSHSWIPHFRSTTAERVGSKRVRSLREETPRTRRRADAGGYKFDPLIVTLSASGDPSIPSGSSGAEPAEYYGGYSLSSWSCNPTQYWFRNNFALPWAQSSACQGNLCWLPSIFNHQYARIKFADGTTSMVTTMMGGAKSGFATLDAGFSCGVAYGDAAADMDAPLSLSGCACVEPDAQAQLDALGGGQAAGDCINNAQDLGQNCWDPYGVGLNAAIDSLRETTRFARGSFFQSSEADEQTMRPDETMVKSASDFYGTVESVTFYYQRIYTLPNQPTYVDDDDLWPSRASDGYGISGSQPRNFKFAAGNTFRKPAQLLQDLVPDNLFYQRVSGALEADASVSMATEHVGTHCLLDYLWPDTLNGATDHPPLNSNEARVDPSGVHSHYAEHLQYWIEFGTQCGSEGCEWLNGAVMSNTVASVIRVGSFAAFSDGVWTYRYTFLNHDFDARINRIAIPGVAAGDVRLTRNGYEGRVQAGSNPTCTWTTRQEAEAIVLEAVRADGSPCTFQRQGSLFDNLYDNSVVPIGSQTIATVEFQSASAPEVDTIRLRNYEDIEFDTDMQAKYGRGSTYQTLSTGIHDLLVRTLRPAGINAEPRRIDLADLSEPVFACPLPGNDAFLVVAERAGRVRLMDVAAEAFDPSDVVDASSVAPVRGVAFHPDFASNGLLVVQSAAQLHVLQLAAPDVARLMASPVGGATGSPVADFAASLAFAHPQPPLSAGVAYAGGLRFHPASPGQAGYRLYATTSDGGDPASSQSDSSPGGKLIRYDVSPSGSLSGATFVAKGLHNPTHLDIHDGAVYLADAGAPADGFELRQLAASFPGALYACPLPVNDNLLAVVKQSGTVSLLDLSTETVHSDLLSVQGVSASGERGLLGLAFHPDFASNGILVLNTMVGSTTRISSVFVSEADRSALASDPASFATQSVTLQSGGAGTISFAQPYSNHNSGPLRFYTYAGATRLYVTTGDGGSAGDPQNLAQDDSSDMGKLFRIAVADDGGMTYDGVGGHNFIAKGLRNPWQFDIYDDTLFLADVGQNAWEEINVVPLSALDGGNFGWRCKEAASDYVTSGGCANFEASTPEYIPPALSLSHSDGWVSVTGGEVYRGSASSLRGQYVFTDLYASSSNGLTRAYNPATQTATALPAEQLSGMGSFITGFGHDAAGELYMISGAGSIWKFDPLDNSEEELNVVSVADLATPVNFGWGCAAPCGGAVGPVVSYQTGTIVGGEVYRGSLHPSMSGRYMFGDRFTPASQPISGYANEARVSLSGYQMRELPSPAGLTGFGHDAGGELYMTAAPGAGASALYKFVEPAPLPPHPPPSPQPPPAPSPPPSSPFVASTLTISVTGGSYPDEVSWTLSCEPSGLGASGGAPFGPQAVAVHLDDTCLLDMQDDYGDGWNGATWTGNAESCTFSSGYSGTCSFQVGRAPPSPPPSPCAPGQLVCGSNCLSPLASSECGSYDNGTPNCLATQPGQQCEADGECGTDTNLDNCGLVGWDIYLVSPSLGSPPPPPPSSPSPRPPPPSSPSTSPAAPDRCLPDTVVFSDHGGIYYIYNEGVGRYEIVNEERFRHGYLPGGIYVFTEELGCGTASTGSCACPSGPFNELTTGPCDGETFPGHPVAARACEALEYLNGNCEHECTIWIDGDPSPMSNWARSAPAVVEIGEDCAQNVSLHCEYHGSMGGDDHLYPNAACAPAMVRSPCLPLLIPALPDLQAVSTWGIVPGAEYTIRDAELAAWNLGADGPSSPCVAVAFPVVIFGADAGCLTKHSLPTLASFVPQPSCAPHPPPSSPPHPPPSPPPGLPPPSPPSCYTGFDIDGDGQLGLPDAGYVAGVWATAEAWRAPSHLPCSGGDFDGDGQFRLLDANFVARQLV